MSAPTQPESPIPPPEPRPVAAAEAAHHASRITHHASLRFGVPSKGRMEEVTLRFLDAAGLPVYRPNPRQYVGRIDGFPDVTTVFQRAADIVAKVDEGNLDIGITGYDVVCEYRYDDDNLIVLMDDLGYSKAQIVVAVPEAWLDIATITDLADLSVEFKASGRELRIATAYPNLARAFLYRHGVNYFALTGAHGALEAAPAMGYADLVVEITETGTTLRDNRLKLLEGGGILRSQACLIGNRRALAAGEEKRRDAARHHGTDRSPPARAPLPSHHRQHPRRHRGGGRPPRRRPDGDGRRARADHLPRLSEAGAAGRPLVRRDHPRPQGAVAEGGRPPPPLRRLRHLRPHPRIPLSRPSCGPIGGDAGARTGCVMREQ